MNRDDKMIFIVFLFLFGLAVTAVEALNGTGTPYNYALWTANSTIGNGNLTENNTGLFYRGEQVCTVNNSVCPTGNGTAGNGTPDGANGTFQYNDDGLFNGTVNLTFYKNNGTVRFTGANYRRTLSLPTTTAAYFGPTLAFGDGDTGCQELTDDGDIRCYVGGSLKWSITSTGMTIQGGPRFYARPPTKTVLTFTPTTLDTDTGIGWGNPNQLYFIAGGSSRASHNTTGSWINESLEISANQDRQGWILNGSGIYYNGNVALQVNTTCTTLYSPDGTNKTEVCN